MSLKEIADKKIKATSRGFFSKLTNGGVDVTAQFNWATLQEAISKINAGGGNMLLSQSDIVSTYDRIAGAVVEGIDKNKIKVRVGGIFGDHIGIAKSFKPGKRSEMFALLRNTLDVAN